MAVRVGFELTDTVTPRFYRAMGTVTNLAPFVAIKADFLHRVSSTNKDSNAPSACLGDPDLPDLVILDLNIPKIPGISVLSQCRPAAPVIVFSSSSNPAEIQRAKELGVGEFVQKPIDLEEFEWVVRIMIQDWAMPASN